MTLETNGFTVHETHGILLRQSTEISKSSDSLGWMSLYASVQREAPYEDYFEAVADPLIILHLNGPVKVFRRLHNIETSRVIPPGGMFILPGSMDFGVRLEGGLQTLHFYVRRTVLQEVAADMIDGDPTHLELLPRLGTIDPLIEHLLLSVRDVLEEEDTAATLYVDYLVRAIAARLIRAHSSATRMDSPKQVCAKLGQRQFDRAIDFMQSNLDRSINLAAIAGAASLSPSHFTRQFRTTVGMAPHQYLVHLRIEHAKRLLTQTNLPIVEIAFACGFANQEHLSRLFKRSCNMTPGTYRTARQN